MQGDDDDDDEPRAHVTSIQRQSTDTVRHMPKSGNALRDSEGENDTYIYK